VFWSDVAGYGEFTGPGFHQPGSCLFSDLIWDHFLAQNERDFLMAHPFRITGQNTLLWLGLGMAQGYACTVCFGNPDAAMTRGVQAGIFLLLGVTGFVLLGFAWFFIQLGIKARRQGHLPHWQSDKDLKE
jgi:hypothetical protein